MNFRSLKLFTSRFKTFLLDLFKTTPNPWSAIQVYVSICFWVLHSTIAIVECRTQKHIDTYTCIADHGLGVVLKRSNKKVLNLDVNNFKDLKFKDYYNNHKEFMNLIQVEDLFNLLEQNR